MCVRVHVSVLQLSGGRGVEGGGGLLRRVDGFRSVFRQPDHRF